MEGNSLLVIHSSCEIGGVSVIDVGQPPKQDHSSVSKHAVDEELHKHKQNMSLNVQKDIKDLCKM